MPRTMLIELKSKVARYTCMKYRSPTKLIYSIPGELAEWVQATKTTVDKWDTLEVVSTVYVNDNLQDVVNTDSANDPNVSHACSVSSMVCADCNNAPIGYAQAHHVMMFPKLFANM